MKSHENAHLRWNRSTNEKPYKCTIEGCDKSFTAKSSLQNHIRNHGLPSSEDSEAPISHTAPPMEPAYDSQNIKPKASPPVVPQMRPAVKLMRFHCIHPNCKKSFKDEAELRAHLIAYNPGMAAENQFLRDSVISLVQAMDKIRGVYPSANAMVSQSETT